MWQVIRDQEASSASGATSSTIVGATREDQLDDIFAAADLSLSNEVMTAIDEVSREILYPMG